MSRRSVKIRKAVHATGKPLEEATVKLTPRTAGPGYPLKIKRAMAGPFPGHG